jgi:hypothetical protein
MKRSRTYNALSLVRALGGAAFALVLALAAAPASATQERSTELSKEDKACLECHAKPGQRKHLADGETLSLYIAPQAFAQSLHNKEGCEGCHSEIDAKTHSKEPQAIASKRAHSSQMQETCRDCHKKTMKQYDDSVHASVARGGSDKAPLCADCHDPHATRSLKDASSDANTPVVCEQCHKQLTQAFNQSVHGPGDEGLECKDCHRTHDVKAASAGDHLRGQCVSCHKDTSTTHAKWLPNTGRHLEAVACAACHSPGATRRVDLRMYVAEGTKQPAEKVGVPSFVKLTSAAGGDAGLDGRALWSLLQDFNRDGSTTFVRGRLEVQSGVQSHALAPKAKALKDCATCHKQGAAAFQQVTVSLIGADGMPLRRGASKGILSSAESIGSVGGFYAIGGTRIKLLDALLVMALAAGILGPLAHLAVKLTVGRRRKAQAQESKE